MPTLGITRDPIACAQNRQRASARCRPSCSCVQLVLHRLGRRKGQLLRRSDLNGFAGRGIPAFARRGFLNLELAEAVEGNLFAPRSEEHTSELQSLMRISYAVFCLKKKKT